MGRPRLARGERSLGIYLRIPEGLYRRLEKRADLMGLSIQGLVRRDVDMTEREQRAWVKMLGPTREERMKVIRDLIHNERGDRMSTDDLLICLRQLARLRQEAKADADMETQRMAG